MLTQKEQEVLALFRQIEDTQYRHYIVEMLKFGANKYKKLAPMLCLVGGTHCKKKLPAA